MPVYEITEKNFEEMVLKSERPVLLEFGAEYCAPCISLAQILKSLSDERRDVLVGVVDVENSPLLAAKFGVMSMPAVIALNAGKVTGKLSDRISKEQVLGLIDNLVSTVL